MYKLTDPKKTTLYLKISHFLAKNFVLTRQTKLLSLINMISHSSTPFTVATGIFKTEKPNVAKPDEWMGMPEFRLRNKFCGVEIRANSVRNKQKMPDAVRKTWIRETRNHQKHENNFEQKKLLVECYNHLHLKYRNLVSYPAKKNGKGKGFKGSGNWICGEL